MNALMRRYPLFEELGVTAIRVTSGLFLSAHGFSKLRAGVEGFAGGLAKKGFPVPTFFAYLATLSELVGGLLLAIGLATRPASASLTVTMVVAVVTTHLAQARQIGQGGGVGFEYPALLAVIFAAFTLAGPNRFSLDARLFRSR